MKAASQNGRRGTKKNPIVPSRDEIIEAVRQLGGEPEVVRYKSIELSEKKHGQTDVLHRWSVGNKLSESGKENEEVVIRLYAAGLQRSAQMLRLSVRLAEMYKQPQLRKMINAAEKGGHELNWAHFRQLLREGLTDATRVDLVDRIVSERLGYRELEDVITGILGGKRSKGGRKPGKLKYKTYAGALKAMRMRSKAWLDLADDWIDQVKILLAKLNEDEKCTPDFLEATNTAAQQLRAVAEKAERDAVAAEAIAEEVNRAMGGPELELQEAVQAIADSVPDAFPESDGVSTRKAAHKVHAKHAKNGKRPRIAKLASAN